tara:strand:+ start:793 stop:993 length:201 start_codon:yes stop_codon:yes gene_type:complete
MKIIRAKKAEKKSAAKKQLEMQIASAFPVNEEMRLINLGIADKDNAEYLEYRLKIGEILETYRSKW